MLNLRDAACEIVDAEPFVPKPFGLAAAGTAVGASCVDGADDEE